jgi:hypothetical protein
MNMQRWLISLFVSIAIQPIAGFGAEEKAVIHEPMIGANVDVDIIIPGAPHYTKTKIGDLFDVAKSLHYNTLRVTQIGVWSKKLGPGREYTAEEWKKVSQRAKETGIRLIPVVEFSGEMVKPYLKELKLKLPDAEVYTRSAEKMIDTILDEAGLVKDGTIAAIDLGNEQPIQAPLVKETYKNLYEYVHKKYPGVLVTAGAWTSLRHVYASDDMSEIGFYNTNRKLDKTRILVGIPEDGYPAIEYEDIVSVHIYGKWWSADHGAKSFVTMTENQVAESTQDYLEKVSKWSKGKPILVEEYGAESGVVPVDPSRSFSAKDASPENQANVIRGVIKGMHAARSRGVNVVGGLVWMLAPRGGPENFADVGNGDCVVIPESEEKEPRILPAAKLIYPEMKALLAK